MYKTERRNIMNKHFKKLLGLMISASLAASSIALPVSAADDDSAGWSQKYDFGSGAVADGYIQVTADTAYSNVQGYGFLGINKENTYSVNVDGIANDIDPAYSATLSNGTNDSETDASKSDYVAAAEENMPIRFSVKVPERNSRYRVKVTVGREDSDAIINLTSEKRHWILTQEPVAKGEYLEYEYAAIVYDQSYKSAGSIQDDMLSLVVFGKNACINSVEITRDENVHVVWAFGDSTVTDGYSQFPLFGYDNYAGYAQGVSKYLGKDYALANFAQSGLNASTVGSYFNQFIDLVKPGDIVFSGLGHNDSKNTGNDIEPGTNDKYEVSPTSYKNLLEGYSDRVAAKGGVMIVNSPVSRITDFDSENNVWKPSLTDYRIKAQEAAEAKGIPYVDLNTLTREEYDKYGEIIPNYFFTCTWITKNDKRVRTQDQTHASDNGADLIGYLWIKNLQDQLSANPDDPILAPIKPFINSLRTDKSYIVPDNEFICDGEASPVTPLANTRYPKDRQGEVVEYSDYVAEIRNMDVTVNESNQRQINSVTVHKYKDHADYAPVIITIYNEDGTLNKIAQSDIDNSLTAPCDEKVDFAPAVIIPDGNVTVNAFVWESFETMTPFSKEYTLTDYETSYIDDDFSGYDMAVGDTFMDQNSWNLEGGSAATKTADLTKEQDGTYSVHISSDGMKGTASNQGSYFFGGKTNERVTMGNGKLFFSQRIKFVSGTAYVKLVTHKSDKENFVNNTSSISVYEASIDNGVIMGGTKVYDSIEKNKWYTFEYTLDMNEGTQTLNVVGDTSSNEVTVPCDNYKKYTAINEITPSIVDYITYEATGSKVFDYYIADVFLAKVRDSQPTTAVVTPVTKEGQEEFGSVAADRDSYQTCEVVTVTATPNEGYTFWGWYDAEGNFLCGSPEYSFYSRDNFSPIAEFVEKGMDCMYEEDFSTLATSTLSANGWTSKDAQGNLTVERDESKEFGNYLRFGANSNSRGGSKSFDTTYTDTQNLVFAMDAKMDKASQDPNEIAIHGGNIKYASNNLNYGCEGGYILHLKQANDGTITLNDQATTIPNAEWFTVTAECDFTAHTAKVTITSIDGTVNYFDGTVTMNDTAAAGFAGIYYKFGKSAYGVLSMDNIKIYTADQLPA